MNFCCIRDFIVNTKLQRLEHFSSKQIKIKHVKKKLFSMTSERKLSRTTSPETQFLQNFTKKKFMISSTQYKITKIRTFFFKINKNKAHKEKAFLHDL